MQAIENKFEVVAPINDDQRSFDRRSMLLIVDLEHSHSKFVDNDFTPSESSLIKDWDAPEVQVHVARWSQYNWKRADEILSLNKESKGKLEIFHGNIEPSDIRQGELGDCYFLSVLSILAEHPNRIRELFITQDVNHKGLYVVRMCINGEWQ